MRTILVLTAVTALTGACAAGGATGGGPLNVVAAENVYGDIAEQIGGSHVHVTSILSDPNADPHLFEPGSSNGLAVATARVVIQNGVGYDAFMTKLEDARAEREAIVLTIADVLGVHGRDANPHLWYDVPKLPRIAAAIATALERADPAHARAYRAGLRRFLASLRPLQQQVARIKRSFGGTPVAYTEPVPGYLIDAAGLKNLAPSSFTRAIEEGTEPPPQAVAAMNALVTGKKVWVLLYNSQAVSPITARIRSRGEAGGNPGRRRDRDAAAAPHVPAVAACAGARALPGSLTMSAVVSVDELALRFGERTLWEGLSFELQPGEFLAVLGPNGTGKTSLIRILLGLLEPSAGRVEVCGLPPAKSRSRVGYVPQQRIFDRDLALRGRDLVRLGLDGHRWGIGRLDGDGRARIDRALDEVGASAVRRRARSAGSPAASSSGCGSRRRSSPTPRSCSPTSRCSRSTSPTSG